MVQNEEFASLRASFPEPFQERFEVLEKIGSGGAGTVYKGWDDTLKRSIALKVLNPDQCSDEKLLRLHREAKTLSQLKHPNIVDVFDLMVTKDGRPVMVMECVDGVSLQSLIEEGEKPALHELHGIFLQTCSSMEYAHSQGVLHRDLTPSNILVHKNKAGGYDVKVVDFGIAKVESIQDKTLAPSGHLIGSITVMSPEQARGLPTVDARSDIYSLGCSMFKAFTGSFPYWGDSLVEIAYKHLNDEIPSLFDNLSFPPELEPPPELFELESVIQKAMQKDPQDRFQSMKQMHDAIAEIVFPRVKIRPARSESESPYDAPPLAGLKTSHSTASGGTLFINILIAIIALVSIISAATFILNTDVKPEESALPVTGDTKTYVKNGQKWIKLKSNNVTALCQLLKRNPDVRRVSLAGLTVTDDQLEQLCKFPLVALDLRDTPITNKSLNVLAECRSLRSLILIGCMKITDVGMTSLTRLPNLICLSVADTIIGDDGVKTLVDNSTEFRCLQIDRCPNISDKSIESIVKLKHLDSLRIGDTAVSKTGVATIFARCKQLGFLGLCGLDLEDSDIPKTDDLNISRLDISRNKKLTDVVLDHLKPWTQLFFLNLDGCPGVMKVKMREFQKSGHHGSMIVHPVSFYDQRVDDTEPYFEPTFFDLTNGNQERVQTTIFQWRHDKDF